MSKIFTKPFRPLDWAASPHDFSGDNQLGPYAIETTQRFIYGTRYLMWDGRVYKYANAVAAVVSYHGCHANEAAPLSYTVAPDNSAVAGSRFINPTLADRTEDDLAGGFAVMYDSTIDDTVQRGIVGNDASATTTRIYLDYPLAAAVTTSDYLEVFENPYREASHATSASYGWLGVPATSAGAGYKFWVQTWGPALISGGMDMDTANYRAVRWGSNNVLFTESNSTNAHNQIAGYILQGSTATAGPLIMLMCST